MHLTRNCKRYRGLSTVDVVAIIALILLVVAGFFIWAATWKKGSDRAGCIMNIRNTQIAIRSYYGMYVKETFAAGEIIGAGKMMETYPECPAGGEYNITSPSQIIRHPKIGDAFLKCSLEESHEHVPPDTSGW